MFRTQETLESGKKRIDDVVASLDDIGVRPRSSTTFRAFAVQHTPQAHTGLFCSQITAWC